MEAHPPDRLDTGRCLLRRLAEDDAERVAASITSNLERLKPWMPWATADAARLDAQRERIVAVSAAWEKGEEYQYLAVTHHDEVVLGFFGLHRRIGPGALELGYWLDAGAVGHGYATSAADALTTAALDLPGVDRVEIHCDEANLRSQAVPRRLGYRLARVVDDDVQAPGEVGRSMIWVFPPTAQSQAPPR